MLNQLFGKKNENVPHMVTFRAPQQTMLQLQALQRWWKEDRTKVLIRLIERQYMSIVREGSSDDELSVMDVIKIMAESDVQNATFTATGYLEANPDHSIDDYINSLIRVHGRFVLPESGLKMYRRCVREYVDLECSA